MSDHSERVPGYRQIRMAAPDAPVAALADEEAWRARDAYPGILGGGGPVFGVAREREEGGWELLTGFADPAPQDSRDTMAALFRRAARDAEAAGDEAARDECLAAAGRLDWEAVDEMTVRGVRHRVVRAEQFIRTGPDGPEPPRPSDPDPAPAGRSHEVPDPVRGMVIDTLTATGMSEGILKVELLSLVRGPGTTPADVRADSLRATSTHPGGVLLPVSYMIAEWSGDGEWEPVTGGCHTPQGARDALALDLRVMAPVLRRLDEAGREEYARAADRLDAERGLEAEVAGRRFRVVRIERLVRVGPDGPEGPRPSDHDPQPPVKVHDQQLREQGLVPDGDEEDDEDAETCPEVREMMALAEKERERRRRIEEAG
ncbi:DUF5954 family protein [Streptomyces sp. XH2]|uniref:DUF5954 family protein n=1 Tax=Streptomyces sp. XH2 TaxID=3412483 RepID=UPI003C7D74FA